MRIANTETPKQSLSNLIIQIDRTRVPDHIAIIPDGNRRWAKQRLFAPEEGHREGSNILIDIVKAAKDIGVKTLTFYAFSTENWSRSECEVQFLMQLLSFYLIDQTESMIENGVKLSVIGDTRELPSELNRAIIDTKRATQNGNDINLVLAINYGGRDEIKRAVVKITDDCLSGKLKRDEISEATIGSYLDTFDWGDPKLLIRTSGELRISNYLLWQIAYAEIHVAPVLWPDFRPSHLLEAIIDYQKRESRWGK